MNPIKPSKELLAQLTARARSRDLENQARTGRRDATLDLLIEGILTDFHAGRDLAGIYEGEGEGETFIPSAWETLMDRFGRAILTGDALEVRRIAEALDRIKKRATGRGPTFSIKPKDSAKLRLVEMLASDATETKARHVVTASKDLGKKISERTARRIAKHLSKTTVKRGRPKLAKIPR